MTAPTPLFDLAYLEEISSETFEDTAQAEAFIRIASAKLRSKVGRLDERIADGTLDIDLVKGTGAAMVLRALDTLNRGINVIRSEYPEISEQYAPSSKTGLIYLTNDELDDLLPGAEDGSDAFTIMPGPRP
ncbi:hypothetical protein [Nocardia sp. N2S4-5]|uniref:hypothetical protein n=1 Tax=Nocardia sp. N2S4-5 TaxID=3351565 RepID=UPI0037D96F08